MGQVRMHLEGRACKVLWQILECERRWGRGPPQAEVPQGRPQNSAGGPRPEVSFHPVWRGPCLSGD